MEFEVFKKVFQQHVTSLLEGRQALFVADVDGDELWETYLDSFPPGTNEVYRERRSHDCSCCRSFVKRFGAVVAIEGNETVTVWDFDAGSTTYQPVVDALARLVKSRPIRDLFVTKEGAYGTDRSREQLEGGEVHTWHHFRVDLPDRFVTRSHKTVDSLMAEARATKEVFKRSLEEIDSANTVLDLIAEGSLYRGEEWARPLRAFQESRAEYRSLPEDRRDNYCWAKSVEVGGSIARIRNHSVGVLLQDLSAGVDPLEAVGRYEHIVAPQNYKRPKPIFTRRMVEQAQATVERLGLADSLPRRHARLDDITVNNVLWANRDAVREMEGLGVFEELAREAATDPRSFERAPRVGIEEFVDALQKSTASSLEVLLENRHEGNLVSLIAPQDRDAPSLFKWGNNFGWAYNGNVADSMKARVKALGGDVMGVLRFSIQWNEALDNQNDFDAHCVEPHGNHIFFPTKGRRHPSTGILDVDIIHPGPKVAVENITWSDPGKMREGIYHFFVHCYSHRGGRSGFRAEIEHRGQVWEYDYPRELRQGEEVTVARVRLSRGGGIEFAESLPSTASSREVWGLATNRFHPVSVVTLSPNHWDGRGVGNRHYFFMLAGCVNPEQPNGFFNEYLKEEFMEQKRVFAALGGKMRVEPSDSQLSGVGFSSTVRASLVARMDGQRVVNIIF